MVAAPREIMWMPGGTHRISALRGSRTVTLAVKVGPETALLAERALMEINGASGGKERAYFDLNHEDREASAWPVGFSWRDQPEPGVYARVDWSEVGEKAVVGKSYRAFSPAFFVDKGSPANITGAPKNMGGLVNDPAFKQILPLWGKCGGGMEEEHLTVRRIKRFLAGAR